MPTAVPSWAAVLMIPDAPPRQRGATSVPRPVAATEDSPMPAPAAAAHSGTAHASAASGISAASATAIRARPAAIRRRATSRGGPGAALHRGGQGGPGDHRQAEGQQAGRRLQRGSAAANSAGTG